MEKKSILRRIQRKWESSDELSLLRWTGSASLAVTVLSLLSAIARMGGAR